MAIKTKSVSAKEFDSFSEVHCARWSDKSLQIVRKLIVDGVSLQEVAAHHSVTSNYANILRWRFLDRMEDVELQQFTSQERPDKPEVALAIYARAVKKLDDQGYTARQIIDYLKTQGVEASESQVKTLIKGN